MPRKIILIGDSAGGNLVASLTIKIIKSGSRIPDGIVMAYPGFTSFYLIKMIFIYILFKL